MVPEREQAHQGTGDECRSILKDRSIRSSSFVEMKYGSSTLTRVMLSIGSLLPSAARRIDSGSSPSYTQNVFVLSSLTYEWTHVTPTSALRSTTPRQAVAPSSVIGIARPCGKVRSPQLWVFCPIRV
jgi:hypothetical protein